MAAPKLLDKRVVNAEVAAQRKQQIDLGVTIAKKVDVIRDTFQEEQKNLETFRTETIKTVQTEIDSYIRKKDTLGQEVDVLEKRKQQALVPLTLEWEEVKKARKACDDRDIEIGGREEYLNKLQEKLEQSVTDTEVEKKRAESLTKRASETLEQADTVLRNAREESAKTRNTAHATLLEAELKNTLADQREEFLEEREREVEKTKIRQAKKDKEQADHDKTIEDKYATLERTLNRIKHG